jgi:WD40 repeat protein/CheY-like chemotaxis protein
MDCDAVLRNEHGGPGAILCVDDDAVLLHFRKLILEREGYSVVAANTLAQALAALRSRPFQLVISRHGLAHGYDTDAMLLSEMKHCRLDVPVILVADTRDTPAYVRQVNAVVSIVDGPSALVAKTRELLDARLTVRVHAENGVRDNAFEGDDGDSGAARLDLPAMRPPVAWFGNVFRPSVLLPVAASLVMILMLVQLKTDTIIPPPIISVGSSPTFKVPDEGGVRSEDTEGLANSKDQGATSALEGPALPTEDTSPRLRSDLAKNTQQSQGSEVVTEAATLAVRTPSPATLAEGRGRTDTSIAPPNLSILASSYGVAAAIAIPNHIPALVTIPSLSFTLTHSLKAHSGWVTAVKFDADGTHVVSGSWDQTVKLWDVSSGRELETIARGNKGVQTVAYSHNGRWIAAENASNAVTLWDTQNGREARTLGAGLHPSLLSTGWVYSIAFSPDSRWLASGVDGKTVRLWDVSTGRTVRDLSAGRRGVIYISFSPDGRWLASGGDDNTVEIWDVNTGEVVRTLKGHTKEVCAVSFSPDGRTLASASKDRTIRIWDLATGRLLHTLTGHRNWVTSVAFSPEGKWLASGSWDNDVKIWDVKAGRAIETLPGNTHPVYSVAFAPHGDWLASGSEDGMIRLWRIHSASTSEP